MQSYKLYGNPERQGAMAVGNLNQELKLKEKQPFLPAYLSFRTKRPDIIGKRQGKEPLHHCCLAVINIILCRMATHIIIAI